MSAFANCGRAVAHVRGSYVPEATLHCRLGWRQRWAIWVHCLHTVIALPDVSWYSTLVRSLRIHFDPSAGVCLSQ